MTGRERVLAAVDHKKTDRVPINYLAHEEVTNNLVSRLGLKDHEELLEYLGVDMRRIGSYGVGLQAGPGLDGEGYYVDMWGVRRKDSGVIYPFDDASTVDDVQSHPWPDPKDADFSWVKAVCEKYHGKYALFGSPWGPFYHEIGWTIGQENFFVWMATKPEVVQAILDKIVSYEIQATRLFLDAADGMVDFTYFGNDFGTQRGLFISPSMFGEFIRPHLKRYYDVSKEYGCRVMQHSCGSIRNIIPALIEDGVDILDPIQTYAANMKLVDLVNDYGDSLTFHGGVDTQTTLPFGSMEDVRNEVQGYLDLAKDRGGYILMSSQEFIEDVSLDNILAMYDLAKKYGN